MPAVSTSLEAQHQHRQSAGGAGPQKVQKPCTGGYMVAT